MYIKVIKNPNHGFACFPNVWWAKIIHGNACLTLPSWQDFFFLLQRLKRHVHIVRYRGERKGWIKENLWVEMMIHLHLSPVYQPHIKPSH